MDGYSAGLTYDGMVEGLYNLSRAELRHLAFEALLITDGPDRAYRGEPDNGEGAFVEAVWPMKVARSADDVIFTIRRKK